MTRRITKNITVQFLTVVNIPTATVTGHSPVGVIGQSISYKLSFHGARIIDNNISAVVGSANGEQITVEVSFDVLYLKQ